MTKKRRDRKLDPFASMAGVRKICDTLRERCPELIPKSDKQLVSLLNAVRHAESYASTTTQSGRPSHWPRADLLTVARELKAILVRETQGRISLSSFVGVHLRILRFPIEVTAALENGRINLQEATLLARLTAERLATTPSRAKAIQLEALAAHLQTNGSQNGLRTRVRSILGEEKDVISTETMTAAVQKADALLEIDPDDKRHLFFEEIRNLFYAMREVEPEDVDDNDLAAFGEAADRLFTIIHALRRKRQQRKKGSPSLVI